MARFKVWLHSPQSRQRIGATRLSVLGLLVAALGVALFTAFRHQPAAAATGKTLAVSAPPKSCGCTKSDDIVGTRLHYTRTSAGTFRLAQSAGGDNSGADVIIPDAARWDTWVLATGEQRILAPTAPLPAGGQWTATFGTVSDNGDGTLTYSAPADVPPYGLDEIDYSNGVMGPNIQLMVSIRASSQSQMAAHGSHPSLHLAGTTPTPTTPCQQQAVAMASLPLLRRIPSDIRGDYARTVRWIKLEQSTGKPSLRIAQATTANGNGYVLPAWVDDASVGIYTPAASPNGAQATKPVVCQGPGPVNPYPPYPPGTTTYNCTPRSTYDVSGSWQAVPVQVTGWKTYGTWKGDVSTTDSGKISDIYHVGVTAGSHTVFSVQYQSWMYHQVQYTDHYKCADSGKNWIYVSTTLCDQKGEGRMFSTQWLSVPMGWPPSGGPVWTPPQCHDIHVQPH